MSAKPDLWMPFYFGAYLTDTMHLRTEQHGAYVLLLMACWKRGGSLPDDDEQLAAITRMTVNRWRKARTVIAPFWQIRSGAWTQKRLTLELNAARERSATATENGKKGGRPRKADCNPEETGMETGTKPKDNPGESSVPLQPPLQGPLPEPKNMTPAPDGAPVDFIFGAGKRILSAAGVNGDKAGSILGKVRKALGDKEAAALLARMAATSPPISHPVEYLMKAIQPKEKRNVV